MTNKIKETFNNEASEYDFTSRAVNIYFDESLEEVVKNILVEGTNGKKLKILDVCCGTGILTKKVAKLLPDAEFVGVDFSIEMLKIAKERLTEYNFTHKVCDICDNKEMENLEDFDLIISSYGLHNIHGLKQKRQAYNNILCHLKSGGQFVCLDIIKGKNKKEQEHFYNFQKQWLLKTFDENKTIEWLNLLKEEDDPETLTTNLNLLKTGGLKNVCAVWEKEFIAIYLGYKT